MSANEKQKRDGFPTCIVEAMKSKDAEIRRLRAERQDTFLSVFRDLLSLLDHPPVLIIVACVCFMMWAINHLPTEINQPRVYLDPAHKYNVTITSTAEQLFSLQSQMDVRMTQHNLVMSQNLDNFTSILIDIASDADLATDYILFLSKIIDWGAGHTAEQWQRDADFLVEEAKKLGNVDGSNKVRMKVVAVTHIAVILAAEMADMEHFLRDTSSASNILLNRLGHTLGDELAGCDLCHIGEEGPFDQPISNAPILDLNAPIARLQPKQIIQWSWDQIDKYGNVHRTTGDFTWAQQTIIEIFLQKMNETGNMFLPTTIRFGIGLPDTYPQDLSVFGHDKPKLITFHGLSILDPPISGQKYTCDIMAHFARVDPNAVTREVWTMPGVLQQVVDRQLVGLQSMECWGEDGEKVDVVRHAVTALSKKKLMRKRVTLGGD
ncbi:hypothetical protein V8E51_003022 [Hyaloscypha variabilis]